MFILSTTSIEIEENAFEGCSNLNQIFVPSTIQNTLFNKLKESIKIDITKTDIGKCGSECIYTFNSTNNYLTIYGNGELSQFDEAMNNKMNQVKEIIISETITFINDGIFNVITNETIVKYYGTSEMLCSDSVFDEIISEDIIVPINYGLSKQINLPTNVSCGEGCIYNYYPNEKLLEINGG